MWYLSAQCLSTHHLSFQFHKLLTSYLIYSWLLLGSGKAAPAPGMSHDLNTRKCHQEEALQVFLFTGCGKPGVPKEKVRRSLGTLKVPSKADKQARSVKPLASHQNNSPRLPCSEVWPRTEISRIGCGQK